MVIYVLVMSIRMLFVMLFFLYTDGAAFNVVVSVARNSVLSAVKLCKYI